MYHMKKNMQLHVTTMTFLVLIFVWGLLSIPVSAHEGHVHEDETDAETTAVDLERMEELISLLEQLVTLLSALRIQQSYAPVADTSSIQADDIAVEDHAQIEPTTEVAPSPKLIIEVETHHDDTHVHVRYVDKPEDMFFVEADINDEDGIVRDVSARTGLSADAIREAIKYIN